MSGVVTVAAYGLREALRRRVFAVVLILTASFLVLYGFGAEAVFDEVESQRGSEDFLDEHTLAGSTLVGLAMFTALFLGAVLAAFLTLGTVRGDADRGLLQPLVVRPIGRDVLLAGRLAAASVVCAGYVLFVYGAAVLITGATGDWWPDRVVLPGAGLAVAVLVIATISLSGSVFLGSTANGIGVFMVFGAGLAAGLLGQIGDALDVNSLQTVAEATSWLLPFEALYQAGLAHLTADAAGVTGVIVRLGPFGGAQEAGPLLWLWSAGYVALVFAGARAAFARRDL